MPHRPVLRSRSLMIRLLSLFFMLVAVLGLNAGVFAKEDVSPQQQAAVLTIKGAIGPAVQDYLTRGFKQAASQQASLIILNMDTPGGLSKSMRGIIKLILSSSIPVATYVAPSGARAASAGTYILYASHVAAMAPGTNLGAATPVRLGGKKDKDKKSQKSASDAKALNDARAYIRSLAQLRGRNVAWAEKAVAQAESLSAKEALAKNVIDVIANNIPDLLKKIDGRTVRVQNQKVVLHTKNLNTFSIQPDWRSRFLAVITDPSVAYILLMIGFYGLFFEFANPGFVAPGVIGAIALLLALYAFQLLPINYVGLGLILLGLAFIVAEAFIPSVGVLGIGGVISFSVGSILLLKTGSAGFGIPLYLIFVVAGTTFLFFFGVLQLAFRARRRRVVSGLSTLVGKTGVVVKVQGQHWVKLEGELWQCKHDSRFSQGDHVKITGVQGLTLDVVLDNEHTKTDS